MAHRKMSRALLVAGVVSLLALVSSASPVLFASLGTSDNGAAALTAGVAAGDQCSDTADLSTAAKPCRKCQDRPWCGCTYNGLPRVSCNPCCYGNYTGTVCFD